MAAPTSLPDIGIYHPIPDPLKWTRYAYTSDVSEVLLGYVSESGR